MLIETVFTPAEIDHLPEENLSEAVCVVFDVLRATTSMITGLANGAEAIYPVATIEEALALKQQIPDLILGGERFGDRIEGFDIGNSPLEYRELAGRKIVTTTTNGTVALRACEGAGEVLAATFLNLETTADHIRAMAPKRLVLVCAGTFREAAFEDILAAGALIDLLPGTELSDASRVAQLAFQAHSGDLGEALRIAKNGRVLLKAGRQPDVEWAAQVSIYPVIARMSSGVIRVL